MYLAWLRFRGIGTNLDRARLVVFGADRPLCREDIAFFLLSQGGPLSAVR